MSFVSLDSRSRFLLKQILNSDGYLDLEDAAKAMNMSKRSIYYDISKINDWLSSLEIPEIQTERQKGVFLESSSKERILQVLESTSSGKGSYYIMSPEERTATIACAIFASGTAVYLEKLAELCMVSRNTIISDMKIVKEEFGKYGIELVYESKSGYSVVGNGVKKRAVFLYYLSRIIHLVKHNIVNFIDSQEVEQNFEKLARIETDLDTEYVEGTLLQLAILISAVNNYGKKITIDISDEKSISDKKEYILVKKYFPEIGHSEQIYFAIHLLGSRVAQVNRTITLKDDNHEDACRLAKEIVQEFEKLACIEFNDREDLIKKLFIHLRASLYRYRYGIMEGNPLAKEIENNYPELFHITGKVSEYLSKSIGYPISSNEVAYLTLHFGAHLRSTGNKKGVVRVLLVCPSGVSTANMLKKELEDLLPNVEIIDTISLKKLENYTGIFDLIISTVEIKHKRHVITVHPILTAADRKMVLTHIFKIKGNHIRWDETDRVFNIVKHYIPQNQHAKVYQELKNYFSQKYPVVQGVYEKNVPGLKDLLKRNRIQLTGEMCDWKKAIALAAEPLKNEGLITEGYIHAMVKSVETYGPYIFLSPEVALAHAKPEDGVLELSVSILISKEGLHFTENNTARVIIVFAPVDNESHLKVLKDIAAFFSEETNVKQFLEAKSVEEAYQIIYNYK